MTDIRLAALEMERIDTHGHWFTTPDILRDSVPDVPVNSLHLMQLRICAEAARRIYGVDTGAIQPYRYTAADRRHGISADSCIRSGRRDEIRQPLHVAVTVTAPSVAQAGVSPGIPGEKTTESLVIARESQ